MKAICISLILLFSPICVAQGTTQFELLVRGGDAMPLPPGSWQTTGDFAFDKDNRFHGALVFDFLFAQKFTSVTLHIADNPTAFGEPFATFISRGGVINEPPLPWMSLYNISIPDVAAQDRDDLMAGRWWVNVTTTDHPFSAQHGQIVVVPEPETWALFAISLIAVGVAVRTLRCRHV